MKLFNFFNKNKEIKSVFSISGNKSIGIVKTEEKKGVTKGEQFPFDPQITEGLYTRHGVVSAVVDKYVDFILNGGFYVVSDDERAKKIIEDYNKEVNFDSLLRKWIKEALIKPHGIMEITDIKQPKILDSKRIFVNRNNKGEIINYIQDNGLNNEITFEENQIAQLCFNQIGDKAYGLGIIFQNMNCIENILSMEKDMTILMKRKANAPIWVKVGTPDEPATAENISAVGSDLEYLNSRHEWVTGHAMEIKTAFDVSPGDKFIEPLKLQNTNLFAGFQIPEVIVGYGNIAEGLAKVQLDIFERRIHSFQEEIEKVIESKIYKVILEKNGLASHVEFEWGMPNDSYIKERINLYNLLIQNPFITPEFKKEMEKDMAKLLGFSNVQIETPEEQRKREETREQPLVPGQNRNQKLNFSEELLFDIDRKELHEFLDFDYKKYLESIVLTTKRDEFLDLIATTEEEVKKGYISKSKLNQLRDIFAQAFEKNMSIQDIQKKLITENIIPSLKSEDLKTVRLDAETRSLIVARTETVRLSALGTKNYYGEKGYQKYSWVTSLGDRTCPICNELNGKIYDINSGKLPPLHVGCRCSIDVVEENKNI